VPREDIAYAYRQSTPSLQRVSNMAVWVVKFPRNGYSVLVNRHSVESTKIGRHFMKKVF